MGLPQRIRGQEASVSLADTLSGQTFFTAALKTASFTYDMDLLEEGYLGEVTGRKDDIFNGIDGDMEVDIQDPNVFDLVDRIVLRAQDRLPQTLVFTLTLRLLFRDGQVRVLTFSDLYFGAQEYSIGGRDEYISGKLPWKCSQRPTIFAL